MKKNKKLLFKKIASFKIGDSVKAKWYDNSFYNGKIEKITTSTGALFIQFNDGDQRVIPAFESEHNIILLSDSTDLTKKRTQSKTFHQRCLQHELKAGLPQLKKHNKKTSQDYGIHQSDKQNIIKEAEKHLIVKKSKIAKKAGYGLFAKQKILKNSLLIYGGTNYKKRNHELLDEKCKEYTILEEGTTNYWTPFKQKENIPTTAISWMEKHMFFLSCTQYTGEASIVAAANSAYGIKDIQHNAILLFKPSSLKNPNKLAYVKIIRDIQAGEEILLNYKINTVVKN